MNRRRIYPYQATMGVVAGLVLASCTTADPGPRADSTMASTGSTSIITTTAVSPSSAVSAPSTPTNTTGQGNPNAPVDAQANTPNGAVAFVNYFIMQANTAYTTLRPDLLVGLSTSECKTCSAMTETLAKYRTNSQTHPGEFITPTQIMMSNFTPLSVEVFVTTDTKESKVLGPAGAIVKTLPPDKSSYTFYAKWSTVWKITAIKSNV